MRSSYVNALYVTLSLHYRNRVIYLVFPHCLSTEIRCRLDFMKDLFLLLIFEILVTKVSYSQQIVTMTFYTNMRQIKIFNVF